jgi:hemoglobin
MMNIYLFEDIEGQAAIDAAVDIFYRIVLSDESISTFFDDTVFNDTVNKVQFVEPKSLLTMAYNDPHHYIAKEIQVDHGISSKGSI